MSGVRVDFKPSGKPVIHGGSGSAYANYGCRCAECTAANTACITRRKKARRPEDANPKSHGKVQTYSNWNCRCAPCTDANRIASANKYRRSTS